VTSVPDNPRHALVAAEVAIENGELDTAEDAILEALSRVRQHKAEREQEGVSV